MNTDRRATIRLHLSSVARAHCLAKNALVLKHLWLVDQCVRALRVHGALVNDATQEGRLALMRAAEPTNYDASRGTPFAPYARMFVMGAIKSCMSADSVGQCTGPRVSAGEPKPQHVSIEAARNVSAAHDDTLRNIDAGNIARAAVGLPLNLRRAAISMLSGVKPSEHARRYCISTRSSFYHYRAARIALCKMFR